MRSTRRLFGSGKVTIPAHIREKYGLSDGDYVEIKINPVEEGEDE
jgi:AbrB family looped-hinge helix DNA binding protein